MAGPYIFTFFREGYEPYNLEVGEGYKTGKYRNYDWLVDLPTGGPYQISLSDSNGAQGGVSEHFAPQSFHAN